MAETFKNQSRKNWIPQDGYMISDNELQIGCLQRIADATELMASNYVQLQQELDRYKRWYKDACERTNNRDRTISNLRGQVTKLKNERQRLKAILGDSIIK